MNCCGMLWRPLKRSYYIQHTQATWKLIIILHINFAIMTLRILQFMCSRCTTFSDGVRLYTHTDSGSTLCITLITTTVKKQLILAVRSHLEPTNWSIRDVTIKFSARTSSLPLRYFPCWISPSHKYPSKFSPPACSRWSRPRCTYWCVWVAPAFQNSWGFHTLTTSWYTYGSMPVLLHKDNEEFRCSQQLLVQGLLSPPKCTCPYCKLTL